MAEDVDVAQPADASLVGHIPMRDEDGELRQQLVEAISKTIHDTYASLSRAIVPEFHEADAVVRPEIVDLARGLSLIKP